MSLRNDRVMFILIGLLSVLFTAAGTLKLAGVAAEVEHFAAWGFPWFMVYLIGAAEVAGGIALVYRPLSGLAAAGLVAVMLGAVGTHVLHAEWLKALFPLALTAACGAIAWIRLPQLLARRTTTA